MEVGAVLCLFAPYVNGDFRRLLPAQFPPVHGERRNVSALRQLGDNPAPDAVRVTFDDGLTASDAPLEADKDVPLRGSTEGLRIPKNFKGDVVADGEVADDELKESGNVRAWPVSGKRLDFLAKVENGNAPAIDLFEHVTDDCAGLRGAGLPVVYARVRERAAGELANECDARLVLQDLLDELNRLLGVADVV